VDAYQHRRDLEKVLRITDGALSELRADQPPGGCPHPRRRMHGVEQREQADAQADEQHDDVGVQLGHRADV